MFPLYDNIPHRHLPWMAFGLIALNVYWLLWLSQQPPQEQQLVALSRGFIPARIDQLRTGQPLLVNIKQLAQVRHLRLAFEVQRPVALPADVRQIVSTLFTAMFLHAGWWHLIGNMWFLWVFGDNVEDRIGHLAFLSLYVVGGVCASGVHWLTDPSSTVPVVGASGAVSAVLGAYLVAFPRAVVRTVVVLGIFITLVDISALVFLGIYFLIQLLEATRAMHVGVGGGVAWWAHVGGFVAGMLLMKVFSHGLPPPHYGLAEDEEEPDALTVRPHVW